MTKKEWDEAQGREWGATVVIKYKDNLLLGAAFDAGLTWCKLGVVA